MARIVLTVCALAIVSCEAAYQAPLIQQCPAVLPPQEQNMWIPPDKLPTTVEDTARGYVECVAAVKKCRSTNRIFEESWALCPKTE